MIKYNSLFPSIKHNFKKAVYIYIPFYAVLSLYSNLDSIIIWVIFFSYVLILEIADYFPNLEQSIISLFITKIEKLFTIILSFVYVLFTRVKTWSIIGISILIIFSVLFFYKNINFFQITNDTKEFIISFLTIYIGVFGVLLGLGFTTQQRTLDKYNDITSDRIFKYLGLTYIFIYILFFIVTTFFIILFGNEIDKYTQNILNYNVYYLIQFCILTIVLILLSKNFFYAGTSKGVMDIFSSYLIRMLKANSTKNILYKSNRDISYKDKERKSKMLSLYTTILFKTGDFLFGKPFYPTFGFYKGNTEQILIDDTKILFRIGLNNIENKNTITFKFCLEAISKVFETYLEYGEQYNGSDKFSLFLYQEIEALFKLALEKDYQPELIELIVKLLSDIIIKASKVPIKNFSQHTETGMFERLLKDFFILSWTKKNSLATTHIINNLKSIGYSYIQQNKYGPTINTIEVLLELGELTSKLEDFWGKTVTKNIVGNIIKLYYKMSQIIIYDNQKYIGLEKYIIEDFYDNLYKIFYNHINQKNRIQYGEKLGSLFYDDLYIGNIFDRSQEDLYRPIYDFLKQIVYEVGIPNNSVKKEFLYNEISNLLNLLYLILKEGKKEYYEYEDYIGFLYNIIDMLYILYIYEKEEKLKKGITKTLTEDINKFFTLIFDGVRTFDYKIGGYLYCSIITLLILSKKDDNFIGNLIEAINNILTLFNTYNDENDLYGKNREFIYSYILFITSWIYKFYPQLELYKTLELFLYNNYKFKKEYGKYSWGSHNEGKFSLYNFPPSADNILTRGEGKIWQSDLNCFKDIENKMEVSDYEDFCKHMNTPRKL